MILKRYIQREILEKLVWIIGLLLLILMSNRFVEYLADAAAGKIPIDLIMKMLLMKMLAVVPRMLPIALFLAVLLALSRLSRDRELTIISSAGVAGSELLLYVFLFAAPFSILVFAVSFYVSPWAEREVQELKMKAKIDTDITGISEGSFKEFSHGDRVVYVEELTNDKQAMGNIFLQVRQDESIGVLTSDSARYVYNETSGSRYILFENGRRYVGIPGTLDYRITEYRKYAVLIEQGEELKVLSKIAAIPTSELMGSNNPRYHAELQWRLSYVIASLLLPLLAVAMNRYFPSGNRYAIIFISILIYFIYSNLLGISKTFLKRGDISSVVGLWWVHLLLILTVIVFFKYRELRLMYKKLI